MSRAVEETNRRTLRPREVTDVCMDVGFSSLGTFSRTFCALASFKDHVAINVFAPPAVLSDPSKKLHGEGKTSRMLKVRMAADIDAASIPRWLKAAVAAGK